MNSKLAECIGLWLAEGDNKTKNEITFTNNCWTLINLFYKEVISRCEGRPRVYVYSPKRLSRINLGTCQIKYYVDRRARKPYYILRLASVSAVRNWKDKVTLALSNSQLYPKILRGFFAGEGYVKSGAHKNRTLQIAQKQPKPFIDRILCAIRITHKFSPRHRAYIITGKWNWDLFAKHRLADLHPDKRKKFWKIYNSYKEEHYPSLRLREFVLDELRSPETANNLAIILNRSQARICDVLMELKKEGKIRNFRVGSKDYWTKKDEIIISRTKERYLKLLAKGLKRTSEFAKTLSVDWKSAHRRLKELEKLDLAKFNANGWRTIAKTNVTVI